MTHLRGRPALLVSSTSWTGVSESFPSVWVTGTSSHFHTSPRGSVSGDRLVTLNSLLVEDEDFSILLAALESRCVVWAEDSGYGCGQLPFGSRVARSGHEALPWEKCLQGLTSPWALASGSVFLFMQNLNS